MLFVNLVLISVVIGFVAIGVVSIVASASDRRAERAWWERERAYRERARNGRS